MEHLGACTGFYRGSSALYKVCVSSTRGLWAAGNYGFASWLKPSEIREITAASQIPRMTHSNRFLARLGSAAGSKARAANLKLDPLHCLSKTERVGRREKAQSHTPS